MRLALLMSALNVKVITTNGRKENTMNRNNAWVIQQWVDIDKEYVDIWSRPTRDLYPLDKNGDFMCNKDTLDIGELETQKEMHRLLIQHLCYGYNLNQFNKKYKLEFSYRVQYEYIEEGHSYPYSLTHIPKSDNEHYFSSNPLR